MNSLSSKHFYLIYKLIFEVLKYALISFVIILILFPIYFLIVQASLNNSEALSNNVFLAPKDSLWTNIKEVMDQLFLNGFKNSMLSVLLINFLRISLYSLASFGLVKVSKFSKKVFYLLFIFVSLTPEISLYMGYKILLYKSNILESNVIFPLIINQIFSFFLLMYLYKILSSVPQNKIKLMTIDNLNMFQRFVYVYLKYLKMPYFLIIIFSSIQAWNDFLWPTYILTSSSEQTISIWFQFSGSRDASANFYNLKAAASFIALIIPLCTYLIFSPFVNKQISKSF
ncbi:ABC transporter permease subunit [Mesomycoplasma hyorhinis]|uniref:ABC transporter permease protein n=5 Tax=Mesomycoplasma hyorhinis TaxID=2100 RepID=A0ABM5M5F3_MESHM|nr:ABC transporter permease subunit [Mesomycoplasma hyorhinis]AEC45860.1 ABC transporter permease protein [Mesomycoplasma hyorhinis MCLD]AEX13925.1 ABC transporter, permease protein [Mesomycoplasma hyorhinis GDL-1]AHA40887.1 ABC transporter permease [Mesomycoplasma hyorhinis DBS 1050]AOD25130.1 ABC transporter permease protein [Mesomycoplasma hyorhinis]MXR06634.1 carbohydrate ABC transporter permease [Mesomycoplasma hyorhinis]